MKFEFATFVPNTDAEKSFEDLKKEAVERLYEEVSAYLKDSISKSVKNVTEDIVEKGDFKLGGENIESYGFSYELANFIEDMCNAQTFKNGRLEL